MDDPLKKAVAGSLGGFVEACLLQPIDMIKTRMQLRPSEYHGFLTSAERIVRQESALALYQGFTPLTLNLTTKYALRFGTNSALASVLADDQGRLSWTRQLLAGFGAGALEATLIATPFDVLKIRMQHDGEKTKALHVLKKMAHDETGLRALWSGLMPTIARNGLQQATMFFVKTQLDQHVPADKSAWHSMLVGSMAAMPGVCLTNPLDVVKTKLAIFPGRRVSTIVASIWGSDGIKGFYKGLVPRLLRVPPGMGIVWAIADTFLRHAQ